MKPPFELPELPYAYDALSPHMSERTLILHHDKHHRSYVAKLNELIAGTHYENLPLEEIIRKSHVSKSEQNIFNNAGQHWNHSKLWLSMKPNGGGHMPPALERRLAAGVGGIVGEAERVAFQVGGRRQMGSRAGKRRSGDGVAIVLGEDITHRNALRDRRDHFVAAHIGKVDLPRRDHFEQVIHLAVFELHL